MIIISIATYQSLNCKQYASSPSSAALRAVTTRRIPVCKSYVAAEPAKSADSHEGHKQLCKPQAGSVFTLYLERASGAL